MSLSVIIIPVFNRRHYTLPCLQKLQWVAQRNDWKIVVVDDASTDGTADAIRAQHPHVIIVPGSGHLYWTGGIDLGMKKARELGATELVWLNDDCEPSEDCFVHLAEMVRGNRKLIVAPVFESHEGRFVLGVKDFKLVPVPTGVVGVDTLAGNLVVMPVEVMDIAGIPDASRWPHYGGDSSYTHQAYLAGFDLWIDGRTVHRVSDFDHDASIASHFKRLRGGYVERLNRLFFSTNSRFRLLSQWHLDILYRGKVRGTAVFVARFVLWMTQIMRA